MYVVLDNIIYCLILQTLINDIGICCLSGHYGNKASSLEIFSWQNNEMTTFDQLLNYFQKLICPSRVFYTAGWLTICHWKDILNIGNCCVLSEFNLLSNFYSKNKSFWVLLVGRLVDWHVSNSNKMFENVFQFSLVYIKKVSYLSNVQPCLVLCWLFFQILVVKILEVHSFNFSSQLNNWWNCAVFIGKSLSKNDQLHCEAITIIFWQKGDLLVKYGTYRSILFSLA